MLLSELIKLLNKAKEEIGDQAIGVFIDENLNIRSPDLQDGIVPVHRVLVTDFYSHKYTPGPAYPYPHFGSLPENRADTVRQLSSRRPGWFIHEDISDDDVAERLWHTLLRNTALTIS